MITQVLALDENKKLVGILNIKSANNAFFNDEYYSELSTGAETFKLPFKVNVDNTFIREGYYLLFFRNNKAKMFQVKTCTDEKEGHSIVRTLYSEFLGINLKNHFIRPVTVDGNIIKILEMVLIDTGYQIGYVSEKLKNNIQTIEIKENKSVYSILQNEILSTFDNVEYEFEVKVINALKGKYQYVLNVYANGERGKRTYKRFEDGRNISSLKREIDISDMVNGLIAEGANGINFKNIRWEVEKGFPLNKPEGDDFLLDSELVTKNNGKAILGNFKSNATTEIDLLWDTYYKLQEIKSGKITYDTSVALTNDEYNEIEVGDSVYVISNYFDPIISEEARIATMKLSFSNPSKNEITFSNYKKVKSKIKNWTTQDTIDSITGFTGKLTQADIDRIREFLASLDIKSEEIDELIKKWEDNLKDTVVDKDEISEDEENYKDITLDKIDGGLWIGDERIYDLKKNKCVGVTTTTSTETTENSSASAKEYKNAVEYYSKFSLGTYSNKSSLDALISSSNKYKISTIVNYWSKKFGLDPYLVYAVIMAESSGNPYCATKSSAGGYGLMQCERSVYFGKKQTIKFLDGSTKSFTPSVSTMKPYGSGNITLNGVSVDKNISNQIMFGCHELRKSLVRFKYNIFAALMGYNFGLYGADWVVCKYVANKNNLNFVDKFGYTAQSSKVQELYFKELETLKAPWANLRKTYVSQKKMGTWWNIEGYLRWYKSIDGQLPYVLDEKGNKKGYGANKSTTTTTSNNTTIKTGVATTLRNKIVAKAKEICELHQKYKKATYDQTYRIVNDDKRFKAPKSIYGIKNPYCYDCSSLVSCSYLKAGLNSVYAKSCQAGTLVESATKKSGYKMFKLTKTSINDAIPGDIIMFCNNKCPSSLTRSQAMSYKFTHHTAIYCGKVNGKHMMAHASKWAYHPNAIRYESFDAYNNQYKTKDYHIWNYCFILRPYDLAAKDKSATTTTTGTTTGADKVVETNEVTLKGLPLATPKDYISDTSLIENVTINNIEDDEKFPKTVSHVFLHFGINDLSDEGIENYKSLIKALLVKYPKKPIFIAKEYHVNSQYGTDFETINAQIDNFNLQMKDFANETQYVVMVNVPNALADEENKYVNSSLTTNGFEMKDKASCDVYYKGYKKAILSLGKKDEASSEPSEPPTDTTKYEDVDITMKSQKEYKYGTCKSVTLKLPSKVEQTFYSKITFTVGPNFKFNQSNLLYLDGSNVTNGALIPKQEATYTIRVYPNPDLTGNIKEKYLGSVSAKYKEGEYYDYKTFKGHNNVVKIANTYLDNIDKFVYNQTTPASFTNPSANKSKWITNGKFHIDCSTFIKFIFMGFSFVSTPYNKNLTSLKRNPGYSWSITLPRTAAEQAKYCVEHGYVLNAIDYTNFENLDSGDLLFFDRDNGENGRFMNISHVAMCFGEDEDGDKISIEVTRPGDVVQVRKIKNYTDRLVLVARVKKY